MGHSGWESGDTWSFLQAPETHSITWLLSVYIGISPAKRSSPTQTMPLPRGQPHDAPPSTAPKGASNPEFLENRLRSRLGLHGASPSPLPKPAFLTPFQALRPGALASKPLPYKLHLSMSPGQATVPPPAGQLWPGTYPLIHKMGTTVMPSAWSAVRVKPLTLTS